MAIEFGTEGRSDYAALVDRFFTIVSSQVDTEPLKALADRVDQMLAQVRTRRHHRHARSVRFRELRTVGDVKAALEALENAILAGDEAATSEALAVLAVAVDFAETDTSDVDVLIDAVGPPARSIADQPVIANAPPAERAGVAA